MAEFGAYVSICGRAQGLASAFEISRPCEHLVELVREVWGIGNIWGLSREIVCVVFLFFFLVWGG